MLYTVAAAEAGLMYIEEVRLSVCLSFCDVCMHAHTCCCSWTCVFLLLNACASVYSLVLYETINVIVFFCSVLLGAVPADELHRADAAGAAGHAVPLDPALRQQHAHRQPVLHAALRGGKHAGRVPRQAHRAAGALPRRRRERGAQAGARKDRRRQ
jgi:hypothetical protein